MSKNDVVKKFVVLKDELKSYFNCENDYFYKVITDFDWHIKENEGIYILNYWKDSDPVNECVLVKKDGEPLIYVGKEYTLIIGIECIKLGFIVKNK